MREDFTRAITEIKPAFGVSVDQLEASMPNGLLHYGPRFTRMFETGLKFISQVKESEKTPLLSVLLEVSPSSLLSPLAPSSPRGLSLPLALLLSPLREVSLLKSGKLVT
jgi:vesicle-fusing ATPase